MDEISIRRIAPQLFCMGLYVCSSIYPLSNSSSSQYSVSYTSFNDISNLEMKSLVPCAYCASWIFTPIDVPLLNNWFVSTDSRCSCLIDRHNARSVSQILWIYPGGCCQPLSSSQMNYKVLSYIAVCDFSDIVPAGQWYYIRHETARSAISLGVSRISLRSNITRRRRI